MKSLSDELDKFLQKNEKYKESYALNKRIEQIYQQYEKVIIHVFKESSSLILEHTNNIYLINDNDEKNLTVYVDDSLFVTELNAYREIIKIVYLKLFNEEINNFYIKTSKYKKFRQHHIYKNRTQNEIIPTIPLDNKEIEYVEAVVKKIKDEKLRKTVKKAMISNLEWNKSKKQYNKTN